MKVKSLFKKDSKCFYCRCETVMPNLEMHKSKTWPNNMATIDHYIPLKRGGADTRDNKVLACQACNHDKFHLTHDEYKAVLEVRARKAQ
jgi:5-methylcytosine-specific restriction endonuclease McrA